MVSLIIFPCEDCNNIALSHKTTLIDGGYYWAELLCTVVLIIPGSKVVRPYKNRDLKICNDMHEGLSDHHRIDSLTFLIGNKLYTHIFLRLMNYMRIRITWLKQHSSRFSRLIIKANLRYEVAVQWTAHAQKNRQLVIKIKLALFLSTRARLYRAYPMKYLFNLTCNFQSV